MQHAGSTEQDTSGVHLWLVLMKTFQAVSEYGVQSWRAGELGDSDFRVLEALLHKGPMPVNTIGVKVHLTSGSISTAVERLHTRGLVTRMDGESDRRIRVVALSGEGRKLIRRVFAQHAREMESLANCLSEDERLMLLTYLKRLGKRAAAEVEGRRSP